MSSHPQDILVILGPTASGKTRLGVQLAHKLGGEILSADSRQVYRGLDIGTGKDLAEYEIDGERIPYHLIDVVELDEEYNVYQYQRDCFEVLDELKSRGVLPLVVGGTGLYLDAVLEEYRMVEAPENPALREKLQALSDAALQERLLQLKPHQHNVSDLSDRERTVRAIEIAERERDHVPEPLPPIRPVLLGVRWPRPELRKRIRTRLVERMDAGLADEVQSLLDRGVEEERLYRLGLEYRYVVDYLHGVIRNRNDLIQKLASAIVQFARRQETWFRRMERRGHTIHWVDRGDAEAAMDIVRRAGLHKTR